MKYPTYKEVLEQMRRMEKIDADYTDLEILSLVSVNRDYEIKFMFLAKNFLIKFIQKIFCKHDWKWYGWSYIKCKTCERTKYNPNLNKLLMGKWLDKMPYSEKDKRQFLRRGSFKRG